MSGTTATLTHATAQAIEALARYRNGCKAPPFVNACDGQESHGAIIEADAVTPEQLPTCAACMVLWDEALSGVAARRGIAIQEQS